MAKSTSRIRFELLTKSRDEFQLLFGHLLGELLDGYAPSKRLGRLDQLGIDAFTLSSTELIMDTAIQCKGFELLEYGKDQQRQCREDVEKYREKGPAVQEYWLVINRPIKDRAMREELKADLDRLIKSGKVKTAELLDLEPLVRKLQRFAHARLAAWAEEKRRELFEYYGTRLQFVEYITGVPFKADPVRYDPVAHILANVKRFIKDLQEHQTGKYRLAPKLLVTSGFGFGKTSTLQALSRNWIGSGGHVIYAPAALLEYASFTSTSGLTDALLKFLLPDDTALSTLVHGAIRDALRETLAKSKDWLLLIDGLDESPAAFKATSLAALWGSMRDLGTPTVISARDELVDLRRSEFFPDTHLTGSPTFERIELNDWTDELILKFLESFSANRGNIEPAAFSRFRDVVETGQYAQIYGDIPRRPLFLGMLAEDAWSGDDPERQLHHLYGKYFRAKFRLDRVSIGASGVSRRPSAMVDALGADETFERLINVMEKVADAMFELTGPAETRTGVQLDTISEKRLREIAANEELRLFQLEDIAMHSLLQPAGRDAKTRERLLRFAHRSFQDWFLARYMARVGGASDAHLPEAVARFLEAMRADLAAGHALP